VRVTDDGLSSLSSELEFLITVLDTAPVLTTADSDGDGVDDVSEGFGDADSDGIPDHLDAIVNPAVLQGRAGVSDKWLLNTQAGLNLRLGAIALRTGQQTASISQQDINDHSGAVNTVDKQLNTGGYFDFEIHGLTFAGQSAIIVIPQHSAVPDSAVYRKYTVTGGWNDFVEDGSNSIASAPGEPGNCPPPGSSAYTAGLNVGDLCVQLIIEDGGPNDADGRNSVIKDPSGVAMSSISKPGQPKPPVVVPPVTNPANNSGGGGGSVHFLWLMLVFGLVYRLRPLHGGLLYGNHRNAKTS
jgi:hypothetical protein